MEMSGQRHAPAALPTIRTRHTRVGGLQGRSGGVRKISPLQGFEPRTVQPAASRYTDCAIPAQNRNVVSTGRKCDAIT